MTDFLMATGLYETYTRKIFSPRPGETVIDVGAHIGFYTVQCARLVGKTGTVIAIEPDPRNFTLLMRNIRLNRLSNVIALNLALGAINGFVSFSLCQDPGSSQVSDSGRIQVKVRRLDDVLMELKIKKIDWIKIDVEGYEMEVLKGAINTLKHNRKLRLIIEVHSGDVLSFMQQLGFSESKLSYNIFGLFGNYFFRRKDGQYQLNET
jgi:FkbM family methyltransferase